MVANARYRRHGSQDSEQDLEFAISHLKFFFMTIKKTFFHVVQDYFIVPLWNEDVLPAVEKRGGIDYIDNLERSIHSQTSPQPCIGNAMALDYVPLDAARIACSY